MLMAVVEPAFATKQLGHTTEMFLNTCADWISGVKDRAQVNLLNNIQCGQINWYLLKLDHPYPNNLST